MNNNILSELLELIPSCFVSPIKSWINYKNNETLINAMVEIIKEDTKKYIALMNAIQAIALSSVPNEQVLNIIDMAMKSYLIAMQRTHINFISQCRAEHYLQ